MNQRIRHGKGYRMEELVDDPVVGSGASQVHSEASGLDTNKQTVTLATRSISDCTDVS